ncbi:MAG: hypothetical protein GY794_06540, partial [bacterium]|nr:hypothetical protein [bacterium]
MSDERSELLADLAGDGSSRRGGRLRRWCCRRPAVASLVGVVVLLLVGLGFWTSSHWPDEVVGWYRIIPPLVAIVAALLTGKLYLSLISGVFAGGLLSAAGEFSGYFSWLVSGFVRTGEFVVHTTYDCKGFGWDNFGWGNLKVLLFIVMLMVIINVMIVGGGLQGVASWLLRRARSARSTRLVAMISGLVIFIDDYANTLIVGPTMRPLTDRQKISREKLAFLVDATAAPIAGIALVSTWVGYEVGQLSDPELGIGLDGYAVLLNSLGFRFYCFGM